MCRVRRPWSPGHEAEQPGARHHVDLGVRVSLLAAGRSADHASIIVLNARIRVPFKSLWLEAVPRPASSLRAALTWFVAVWLSGLSCVVKEVVGDFTENDARVFAEHLLKHHHVPPEGQREIFSDEAWKLIYEVCGGNPRAIRLAISSWGLLASDTAEEISSTEALETGT